ncbi:MAG: glycosyltransferase [Methylovirgula sp.]
MHDAIGNDVLGMYLLLRRHGHDCRIFSLSGETRHPIRIGHYEDVNLFLDSSEDIVIFHYCVADPIAFKVLRKSPACIILKYHNLTPATFMARWSKDFALACKRARDSLQTLCNLPLAWVLNDSDYNMQDIAPLLPDGIGRSTVAPMHRIAELLGSPDDPETKSLLDQAWFNLLTVGRAVPNKALDLMMPALARLRDSGTTGVRLHIAGGRDPRLQGYTALVEGLIARHDLQADVVWHHSISASKLATLYRHCDVLWTTSQHEGFCVPVIEAMAFELPVLSTRRAALPETCGNAAAFADHTDEMANQLHCLATDDTLRAKLGERGGRRYRATYRMDMLEQKFLADLDRARHGPDPQPADEDADWFGLPFAAEVGRICDGLQPASAPLRLASADGRRNFVDWLSRAGIHIDAGTAALMGSDDMQAYARRLEVPEVAEHLTPRMRFAWHFNPFARAQFTLQTNHDVAAFLNWYCEYGAALYDGILPDRDA